MLEKELQIYNPGCDNCGTCCNFDTFDHELYASTIEVNFISENVKIPPCDPKQRFCPFLVNKQCTIREYRTLGCRVFFCNPDYKNSSHEIYNKYYEMIKKIAIRNKVEWQYAPLTVLLASQNREEAASTSLCAPNSI
ncbi:MAG: hypothetical protein EX341_00185 [Candidatus Scalindua sp. SCAELEC01]|nr:MAG: hypothetical protein EX341_00185 [Candidatus Scalindua sp. SCAELEC01]